MMGQSCVFIYMYMYIRKKSRSRLQHIHVIKKSPDAIDSGMFFLGGSSHTSPINKLGM